MQANFITLSFKNPFSLKEIYFLIFLLICKISKPIKKAGTIPTSDNTEYLPPIVFLCSTKNRLNFFDNRNNLLIRIHNLPPLNRVSSEKNQASFMILY